MQFLSKMISLRKARQSDMENIHKLFAEVIDNSCTGDYDAAQRAVWKSGALPKRWQDAIGDQYFLVAEIGGEIAGFGSLLDHRHIDFMFTSKNHLRLGVAKSILTALEAEAEKAGTLAVTSDVSKTAVPFFLSQGFVIVRTNHLLISGVDIDNFRMEKHITKQQ